MISDYTSLQAAVASWLKRTDLAAVIPDFIMLAEQRMNGDLDTRSMEVRTSLACVANVRTVALPSDMVEMKRVMVTDSDPAQVLEYKSPDQIVYDNPYLQRAGRPTNFTVIGGNLELSPMPDLAYPLELIYQQRIPPLSASNATNWALTQNPNIYLFGALMESAAFTLDESRLPLYESKYREAVKTLNEVDWYSGSTMRVRSR